MDAVIRPLREGDLAACAALVAATPLWKRYRYTRARCARDLRAALASGTDVLLCAEAGGRAAGIAWVLPRGTFGRSAYLKLIAVAARRRGRGLGALLLAAAEESGGGELTLLVSDFNGRARRFYAAHGYHEAGALPDFVLPGVAEIILRKGGAASLPRTNI